MIRSFKPAARLTALALAALLAGHAQAITFEQLDASGAGTGVFYNPTDSDWVLAPGAVTSELKAVDGGWSIDLSATTFGAAEGGTQASNIYGAGLLLPSSAHGWRVNFSANLRTWDSYNDGSVVQPNTGASLGDWDLFAVNANTQGYYWDLTSTTPINEGDGDGGESVPTAAALPGTTGLIDPLVPVRPAGSVVTYTNDGNSGYLPGSTWAWGGRDYAEGYFESVRTSGMVELRTSNATFVSFVLDSRTPGFHDNQLPSWGQFGVSGVYSDVPNGPSENPGGGAPGYSIENPLLPSSVTPEGTFVFSGFDVSEGTTGLGDFLFIDPDVVEGYVVSLDGSSGQAIVKLKLPQIGDADGFLIEGEVDGQWVLLGQVTDGGELVITQPSITKVRILGINPDLGLDPLDIAAFKLGLIFDKAGLASLSMTPLTTAVPEPTSLTLLGAGLAGLLWRRRRQASRAA